MAEQLILKGTLEGHVRRPSSQFPTAFHRSIEAVAAGPSRIPAGVRSDDLAWMEI